MGDIGDVPRITCRGAYQKNAGVLSEVGGDNFHKLLRGLGDWGLAPGGYLWGTSVELPLDLALGSIPEPIDKEYVRCRSVNTTIRLNGTWRHLLIGT